MIRRIGAVLAGMVAAFIVVALVEYIGRLAYPPPGHLDYEDVEMMRSYVSSLPLGALFFVLAAWYLGTLAGARLACLIALDRPIFNALVVGAFLLAATLVNLFMIPHPLWFSIVAIVGIIAMAVLAALQGARVFSATNKS
jgi:hypothetical protein